MFNAAQSAREEFAALRDWKHQKRHLPEYESDAPTCRIQWIDKESGKFTPDKNPAVCMVRVDFRISLRDYLATFRPGEEFSQWFPCCAEHANLLTQPRMIAWERRDL